MTFSDSHQITYTFVVETYVLKPDVTTTAPVQHSNLESGVKVMSIKCGTKVNNVIKYAEKYFEVCRMLRTCFGIISGTG